MAKNYRHRSHATQRYAGTTAGFYNDFVHITGVQDNYAVTPSGGYVLVSCVINTAPASGVVQLRCGQDIIATISSSASATFEHRYNCYMYDQIFLSCGDAAADITIVITKGFQQSSATND